jgi:TPR repeat protein
MFANRGTPMKDFDEFNHHDRMEEYAWRTECEMETIKKAESGDAEAQYQMAQWHTEGGAILVKKNPAKAAEWLNKAAAQGHEKAKQKLAEQADMDELQYEHEEGKYDGEI